MVKTRMKIGCVAFLIVMAAAIAKHWLPGISETMVAIASTTVLGYILGDTLRKS